MRLGGVKQLRISAVGDLLDGLHDRRAEAGSRIVGLINTDREVPSETTFTIGSSSWVGAHHNSAVWVPAANPQPWKL